jgi:hypothetical protein
MEPKDLYIALSTKAKFEMVTETVSETQLRIIGRLPQQAMSNWLLIMDRLLESMDTATWKVDISKQYFRRAGKVLFGWRLIFVGDDILSQLPAVIAIITNAPKAKALVDEAPLFGSRGRNELSNGRGAQSSLSASVGPMAIARMKAGG